jgi:hypothetical protein
MFDKQKITDALKGLVGFRQPTNPDYAVIDSTNLESRSGYYFDDNPYVKVEYLKDNTDYKDISDADFNTLLQEYQESAIASVCGQVFDKPSYIDRNLFYRFAQNKQETDTLPEGFIGYRIRVEDKKNLAFELKRVFLDFDLDGGSGETIDLVLYNTAIADPIESISITLTDPHQEVELNWVVNNTDGYYKGEFYLGYVYTNSTQYDPYKRNYNASNVLSCYTHLFIEEIKVVNHTTNVLFDLDDVDGLSESTGLNFDLTVFDDYTDMIINNERLFSRAVFYQGAINMLSNYTASLRSNRNQRQSEENVIRIIQEIEGQDVDGSVKITGLRPQLFGQLHKIRKEIERLKKGYFGEHFMVTTRT